eukprot:1810062-Amphidinium_carterae.2
MYLGLIAIITGEVTWLVKASFPPGSSVCESRDGHKAEGGDSWNHSECFMAASCQAILDRFVVASLNYPLVSLTDDAGLCAPCAASEVTQQEAHLDVHSRRVTPHLLPDREALGIGRREGGQKTIEAAI